jgi:protease YdgD
LGGKKGSLWRSATISKEVNRTFLASLLVPATPAFAIDPQHLREIVDVQKFPWSSIGKVSSVGEQCSSVAVGADQFLTEAHCLYMPRTGHFLLPGSINILLGYERGG